MSTPMWVTCPECGVSVRVVADFWIEPHDVGVAVLSAPAEGRPRCAASLRRVASAQRPRTDEGTAAGAAAGSASSPPTPESLAGEEGAEVATMRRRQLPPDLMSAGEARRIVRHLLAQTGHVELIDTAELLVSEIVTSALYGASTTVELRCTVEELGVRVEVNVGQAVPAQRSPVATGIDGRGVALLDRLANRWGISETDSVRTVWFVLATMPPLDSDEPWTF